MNWIQKVFVKAAEVTGAFRFQPNWIRYAFLPITRRRMLDGYLKNSAVAACVTTLAFSFPEAPLVAGYETPEGRFVIDYTHPVMKLIRQPNPDMGEAELMEFAITYASIGGNLYLWKQRSVNGKVIALWPFNDVQMMPIAGQTTADGFVKEYWFNPGDGTYIPIPKEDIIHWKWMPDPEQPWRGIGAIEFSIRDSDRDMEANAYIYALLKNNAVPPIVVTLTEGEELTTAKAKRLRKEWSQTMGGENRGNVAFLEAGMKAERLGFDLQQLAAEALNAVPEARIAGAFHIPPVVAGLSVGLKRSDYGDKAARQSFTELTLAALWRSLASEMWNGLKDEFPYSPANPDKAGASYTMRFDLRQVRALQEDEKDRWERVTLAFNRSMITRADAKQEVGIEPQKDDQVYIVSLATEIVPAGETSLPDAIVPEKTSPPTPLLRKNAAGEGSERKAAEAVGRALQRIRLTVAKRMETSVNVYFSQLSDRVVARLGKSNPHQYPPPPPKNVKELPSAEDLLTAGDAADLATLVKRFYLEMLELSWNIWNVSLGVDVAFDLTDPIVPRLLGMAGQRVQDIQASTLDELRQALQYGSEQGWSIDQLVRGDPENGIRGLRDIVDETYQNRARAIARTELGDAQNAATAERYQTAGVKKVMILDDGAGDEDDPCIEADGQIWTTDYFDNNRLEHPNCTRAAAPYFGEAEPDQG